MRTSVIKPLRTRVLSTILFTYCLIQGLAHTQFSSVAQSCPTLCDPMNRSTSGLPVHHQLRNSPRLTSIESVMPSNHLILCHPLSSCLQSFPASGSFQMSQLFSSGGQSIGISALASFLPKKSQGWSPWHTLGAQQISESPKNVLLQLYSWEHCYHWLDGSRGPRTKSESEPMCHFIQMFGFHESWNHLYSSMTNLGFKYSSDLSVSSFHCQHSSPTWLPLVFCLVWTGGWAFCLIVHYAFWCQSPLFCLRHQRDLFKIQILFIAALFTIARTWKQPKYPLTEKWVKRMWNMYTVD